jgi:FG-GAP-like repeat
VKPLRTFLVAGVLLGSVLMVPAVPWQRAAGAGHELYAAVRGHQRTRPPATIWERMSDPRGWWQSRLLKPQQPAGNPQVRASVSAHPFDGGAITNPVFFVPPTYDSGGKFARNPAIGDFNGDGKPDLLISNQCVSDADCTQGTVGVLLGNGDGTFQSALTSPTGAVLATVALGDFNRDGKLDVVVDNACPDVGCTSGSVNILLGNGDGTFQPPVAYPSGGNAFSVEAGDVNGDGKLDVVVVNGPNVAGVLLGNGDGTFQPASMVTTSTSGNSAVFLGDFNNDDRLDLAVVTDSCDATPTCTRSFNILLGNGDGTFGSPVGSQSSVGLHLQGVGLGDVNGDGNLDLAVAENCVPMTSTCTKEFVQVFLGNGDGTFGTAKNSSLVSSDVGFMGFADLNGDGKPDLVTVDPDVASVTVMPGAGDGTFQILNTYESEGTSPVFGAIGDLNGDGKSDLAVANLCQVNSQVACTGTAVVFLADSNGTLQGPADYPVTDDSLLGAVAVADFNGDGKPDLAELAMNFSGPLFPTLAVNIFQGQGDGRFVAGASAAVGMISFYTPPLVAGDFNHDGNADLVTTSCLDQGCTTSGLAVLLGNGNGTFQPPLLSTTLTIRAMAAGDLNGDGKLDLVGVTNTCTPGAMVCNHGFVNVLLGNGDGTFQAPVNYPFVGAVSDSVTLGDFNLDGVLDVAVANNNCTDPDCPMGTLSVFLGNGDGTLQTAVNYSSGDFGTTSVTAADFNGDGKLDLAVANSGQCFGCGISSIGILLGKGDGSFQSAATFSSPDLLLSGMVTSLTAADFDLDGKLDLALSSRNIMLGNGDGTFQDSRSYKPGNTFGVSEVVADLNGDGKPDLAVTTTSFLTVLLNISAGDVQDFGIAATPLSPATMAAGDSATSTITITSLQGFNGSVDLSCSAITPAATPAPSCSFSPSSVTGGAGTATLTVSTTAAHVVSGTSAALRPFRGSGWAAASGCALLGLFLLGVPSRRRRGVAGLGLMVLVLFAAGMGCGGGSGGSGGGMTGGTPKGRYTITVTASSASPQRSHAAAVAVTVR